KRALRLQHHAHIVMGARAAALIFEKSFYGLTALRGRVRPPDQIARHLVARGIGMHGLEIGRPEIPEHEPRRLDRQLDRGRHLRTAPRPHRRTVFSTAFPASRKPHSTVPPRSKTGRLRSAGCSAMSAMARASVSPSFRAPSRPRQVVLALLRS